MDSSSDEDPIDAFFKGKIVKNIKKAKPSFTTVISDTKKENAVNWQRNIKNDPQAKIVEERKLLTEYLNLAADDIDGSLGIEETDENQDFQVGYEQIYKKYQFEIPRQKLPIESQHDILLQAIRNNKVVILKANTGCGKSSQVPSYILEDCYQRNVPCNIIITQPKKISAESLATRVAFERKCEIGSLVGYQIGLDRQMDAIDTRILYCTTGVFLQKLVHYKSLQKWTHVIIDEIHERDLDMDMVLLIIRRLMVATKSRTKIILMSATLNCDQIAQYFEIIQKPPIMNLDIQRPFPIKIHYLDELEHLGAKKEFIDMNEAGINQNMLRLGSDIIDFFAQKGAVSFLVFLPGLFEIESFHRQLCTKRETFNIQKFEIFILHSSIPLTNMKGLYDKSLTKKIVLATNIAESSITIPGIQIIIDYCLTKYLEVDGSSGFTQLKLSWASKMNMEQRAGRTGRTGHGQVVRMLYKDQYETLSDFPKAEMQRTSLENIILKIKNLEMGRPSDILAIALDPPERKSIVDAILMLKENCALTRFNKKENEFDFLDGHMTFTGAVMSKLPMDIRLAKLVVLGYVFSVIDECIIIAAGLSVGSIFNTENSINAFETKLNHDSSSDLIAILNAYNKYLEWVNNNNDNVTSTTEEKWCRNQMMNYKNVQEMSRQINDIRKRIRQFNILNDDFRYTTNEKLFVIKMCIAGAFYPNFYTFGGEMPGRDDFRHVHNKNLCSTVYFQNKKSTRNGQLYEEQIRDLLYQCEIVNCPDDAIVSFDTNSQKIFVQFNNLREDCDLKMPGDVKLEVYKSIKFKAMKKYGDMNILMMSPEDEEEYAPSEERRDLYNRENVSSELKLKAKMNIYPSFSLKPEEKKEFFWGDICHIISPSKFYFQPRKALSLKNKLMKAIGTDLQQITDIDEIIENNRIMIKNDGYFKRAEILEFPYNNDIFKVLLIDYGRVINCTIEDFYTGCALTRGKRQDIIREFFKMSPLCYECKLAEIKPTPIQQYSWSKKAIDDFKDMTRDKIMQLELYAFNAFDKVATVDVFTRIHPESPSINVSKKLVDKGLADYSTESYADMISKTLTDNSQSMKYEIHKDRKTFEIRKELLTIPCELMGPFSPLETLRRLGKINRASEHDFILDFSSVNCALVDPYPYDGIKKVLVASTKSKTNRGNVTLRQTTIMPFLKGMSSILALIFAPCAEIRYNKEKTRYTSILTGLGCDFMGKPYYGEHDCLLRTDVELDEDDFKLINSLRNDMSTLMQQDLTINDVNPFANPINPINMICESRTRACSGLLKIIKKQRLQLGENFSDGFNWTDLTKKEKSEHQKMFPNHNAMTLCEISRSSLKRMMHHLRDLEQKAKYNSRDESIECMACEESIETLADLRNHLLKIKHIELKAKYKDLDHDSESYSRK